MAQRTFHVERMLSDLTRRQMRLQPAALLIALEEEGSLIGSLDIRFDTVARIRIREVTILNNGEQSRALADWAKAYRLRVSQMCGAKDLKKRHGPKSLLC